MRLNGLPTRLAAVAAAALLLGACASGGSTSTPQRSGQQAGAGTPAAAAKEVRIVAQDNRFEPAAVRVTAGQPVVVVFVNEGQNVHEVEIKDLIPETALQPGESRQFTITPDKKSYTMYCEIHEDTGMEGEFIGE